MILLMPFSFMAVGLLIIFNTFSRKIMLYDDRIAYTNFFKTREIFTTDIRGYRVNNKVLTIESKSTENKPLRIGNYIDFRDSFALVEWLKNNFKDVDTEDLKEQKEQLLRDTSLGVSEQDRQLKLDAARKLAIGYNILGVVIAVMVMIYHDNVFVTILAVTYPVAGVVIMKVNRLIKFVSDRKRSMYPFIMIGVMVPSMIMFFEFTSTNILAAQNFWLPFLAATLILAFFLCVTGINESIGGIAGQIVLIAVISIFYGLGSVVKINCVFDHSPDKEYKASVLGHHISRGKHTSYILYLSTWGPCNVQKQIDVGSKMYNEVNPGDSVKIDLKPGLLHIPWFVVYHN